MNNPALRIIQLNQANNQLRQMDNMMVTDQDLIMAFMIIGAYFMIGFLGSLIYQKYKTYFKKEQGFFDAEQMVWAVIGYPFILIYLGFDKIIELTNDMNGRR